MRDWNNTQNFRHLNFKYWINRLYFVNTIKSHSWHTDWNSHYACIDIECLYCCELRRCALSIIIEHRYLTQYRDRICPDASLILSLRHRELPADWAMRCPIRHHLSDNFLFISTIVWLISKVVVAECDLGIAELIRNISLEGRAYKVSHNTRLYVNSEHLLVWVFCRGFLCVVIPDSYLTSNCHGILTN